MSNIQEQALPVTTSITGDDYIRVVYDDSGADTSALIERKNAGLTFKRAILQDVKAANTSGGTFTTGAWRTRDLNTIATDPDTIILSLAANQFVLAAGTYRIYATAPAIQVEAHKAALANITDAVFTILGTSEESTTTAAIATRSIVSGYFTIAEQKTFSIQHRGQATRATFGFGFASNFGVDEIYTIVELWKI